MAASDFGLKPADPPRPLSEAQRLECRRRMDCCLAVLQSIAPLAHERARKEEIAAEQIEFTKAKWPWVLAIVAVLVGWAGRTFDLSFASGLAYLIGFFLIYSYGQAWWEERTARLRIADIDTRIHLLRFHWIAAIAPGGLTQDWASISRVDAECVV